MIKIILAGAEEVRERCETVLPAWIRPALTWMTGRSFQRTATARPEEPRDAPYGGDGPAVEATDRGTRPTTCVRRLGGEGCGGWGCCSSNAHAY